MDRAMNHFHSAGGMGYVISQLLDAKAAHRDIMTVGSAGWNGAYAGTGAGR
jgi:dihydroxyacid dehydratase/phosphogluconate dehydratase